MSPIVSVSAKPNIKILATGGTIAGVQGKPSEAGYTSGALSADVLIKAIPQLSDLANLSTEQISNIGSQTMNHEVWLKLASRVNAVLKQSDVDGVVITHGTDTMEETAYFLSLVVHSDKPVVLVGAMRPSTALGADGPANLYNAVALAGNPSANGRGPLVIMNDEVHYAREVEKTTTTLMNAFQSPNRGRAGIMNTGSVSFFNPNAAKHTTQSAFSIEGLKVSDLPKVEIIYSYANLGSTLIDHLVADSVNGIVLAGVGDGNTTDAAIAALAKAAKHGIAVVRSSRTGSGLVVRNVEINDDQSGFIAAMELNPQKARILLMLGLLKTKDPLALQQLFYEY
ncbi:MAG TPA: type II asparaginase [Opitutaceae bacterium]|nr:type II asparaginase [Opitutaceae bacterium]